MTEELDWDRIYAITRLQESRNRDYDSRGRPITSPKGARYAMQTMPATAGDPGYGVRPAASNTPEEYNRVGRDYLRAMQRRYGSMDKAWAAYNGGPGRMDRAQAAGGDWLSRMPAETRDYVRANMARLGSAPQPQEALVKDETLSVAPEVAAGVSGGVQEAGGGLNAQLIELQRDIMSSEERQRAARREQLAQATRMLQERRLGPSREEQLLQLASAFLQPRRYKGFGATLENVLPVLAQQRATEREGRQGREDRLMELQNAYQNADMEGETGSLKARRDLLDLAAKIEKANQPDIQLDDQGRLRTVPKPNQVRRPKSKAEYDAIPAGEPYVVPSGPQAGTVVYKR